ncbi:ferric-rhodotorulic acid/ferric-coprogen receptor FhuE [Enterobacterales bacterium CwR94]|nr:ferric-rhodotorulic acid/ferric-coprogen receptor FhuE [Enterobacterales bacterium CwR94]
MSFVVSRAGKTRVNTSCASVSPVFARSLLGLLVATAVLQAPLALAADEETLTVEASADATADMPTATDSKKAYVAPVSFSGTKMALSPRQIPQTTTVMTKQRIQDQDLETIGDVMSHATGITKNAIDTDRVSYYSRGFLISNFVFDGIPTTIDPIWNFGDSGIDAAIYDRVEVVRGANGLMTGVGNPGAAVNMVRKHADSRELTGNLSALYGSWDKQRYVGDVSTPLNEEGTVRARAVAGYQDNNSFLDRYKYDKKFLYTVLDADLTDSTTLSLGWEFQNSHTRNPTWGGWPTWFSDGTRTDYDRRFNAAPDWAYSDMESSKIFLDLTQRFDSGWAVRLNGTHSKTTFDSKLGYPWGYPDKETGEGVIAFGGWNKGTRNMDSVDLYANGPFELFGREHELVVGGAYSKQHNFYYNAQSSITAADIGNYNNWDGNITEGTWSPWTLYQSDYIRQKSFYSAARISLADPLMLVAGARYTEWRANGSSANTVQDDVTPYAGLIYDINDNYSAYVSYTGIFQPQTTRDADKNFLKPTTGKNYEAGVKGDWMNSRLTAALSVFRIEQENLGVSTGAFIPGTSEYAYQNLKGTVSRGVELEVNGAITDNWNMMFGASRFIAEDKDGISVNPDQPRTTLKLFTSYRLPFLQDLTVGGGVNWQNSTWWSGDVPAGATRPEQSSFALVSLFSRYQVTKDLSVQANVNNLFDKEYYDYLNTYGVYGEPRSFSVQANYQF